MATPAGPYGPEPIQLRPIVLVLGPGWARGFAHAGVLRALHEAKIPIGAIVGTEVGALMGALYSLGNSINGFEWSLLKFKDGAFSHRPALIGDLMGGPYHGGEIEDALAETLRDKDIAGARIPLRVGIQYRDSQRMILAEKGSAARAVRAALVLPGAMEPGVWDSREAQSTVPRRPVLVSEARALRIGPVVAIDLLETGWTEAAEDPLQNRISDLLKQARQNAANELKDADLVIRPELGDIGPFDFKKRTESSFRGKSAVRAQISAIRHLVGLPPEDQGVSE